jgi:hypothetical protein
MGEGFLVMNEKDWEKMTAEQRDWAVFNTLCRMDQRLSKLEKRPIADKCFSFLGGVIGGFLAAIGIKIGGHN